MPDFGTFLPFKRVLAPTTDAWCALMLRIAPEHIEILDGVPRKLQESWAYFLWLPGTAEVRNRKEPELFGITPTVPYEHLYGLVEQQPVCFLRQQDVDLQRLGCFLLDEALLDARERQCLVRTIVAAQSGEERERFERFKGRLLRSH